jgi:myosin-5
LVHHAAACGDFHVVKYMLEHSQEFMTRHELFYLKNSKGNTAFHEACGHGQYEMVKFLMVQARIIADDERNKPLERTESTTSADTIVRQEKQPHDDANSNNSNQNQDQQPHEPFTKDPSALPKKANEEPQEDAAPGILYSGYLRKRRETSRWMRRFVVLNVNSETRFPQLEYFANGKPATLQGKSSKRIDLRVALFKKSMDTPFAFEIHSPHLLEGRNKEGRLYFAAENELEIQKWLAHLRNSIPSSIESRIFAMHRGTKYGKLEFVDFQLRKTICNLENRSRRKETPLHLAASVSMASTAAGNFGGSLSLGGKATILESAVTTSSLSVSVDEESHHNNNNQSSSELCSPQSSKAPAGPEDTTTIAPVSPTVGKTKLEVEADIVRTVLWLIENGADINAMTAKKETALKRAIKANNLLVAKYLLDRGALATGLSPSEIKEAQRLKASLAKNAISSVGSSSLGSGSDRTASSRFGSSSSLRKIMGGATGGAGGANGAGGPARESDMPLLFLLKQPGKTRNSSYVSVFLEHLGISTPQYLSRPRLIISVVDSQCNLVEMKQQVSIQPVVLPSSLLWSITWHMQTPLENLPHGACVILELTISPMVSANSATPASSAEDFVPVCWTYLQVDQRTANCMPLNAEMYKYPMDLTLKKLQRVDAFINGDVFVSQGPQ